jgi:hypothetical protein
MKATKELKRQAARAERFASISADDEYARSLSDLAAAFRAQAEVLKKSEKKDKKERKKDKEK